MAKRHGLLYLFLSHQLLAHVYQVFTNSYYNLVLVQPAQPAPNSESPPSLLTTTTFGALWELDARVRALALKDGRTYADLCLRVGGQCASSSPLNFWTDQAAYDASVGSDAELRRAVSAPVLATGNPVSRISYFGSTYIEDPASGDIAWAGGTMAVYIIDGDISDAVSQEWEDLFLSVFLKDAPANPTLDQPYPDRLYLVPNGYRSLDAELTRVVTIDLPLVLVEYVVMFLFVALALSWGQQSTKAMQAGGTLGSVLLSTMTAYGICAACGVPLTQLVFILPFILVGIGVDDAFVIITTYRSRVAENAALGRRESVEEAVSRALGHCSLSICYTTLTDIAAFGLGTLGTIPAVRYFCAYAAVAVACDFVFQITFFLSVLVIDERKALTRRHSSPAVSSDDVPAAAEAAEEGAADGAVAAGGPAPSAAAAGEAPGEEAGKAPGKVPALSAAAAATAAPPPSKSRQFCDAYVGAIASRPGLAVVMACFVGLTAFSGWAVSGLTTEFDPIDIVPGEWKDSGCSGDLSIALLRALATC